MRKDPFIIGQYYHIYNRGTDKRIVFKDSQDLSRFLKSVKGFNVLEPIDSLFKLNRSESRSVSNTTKNTTKLVDIICYCLNPNHYHLILTPLVENGIEKFMQKLGAGFTRYFNDRHKRTGALFQGRFKSIYIDSDKYLMYLSAYVNLNNRIHNLSSSKEKHSKKKDYELFYKSSWGEFVGNNKDNFCNKSIILDRYENDKEYYKEFAKSVVKSVLDKRLADEINIDFSDEDIFIDNLI